MVKYTDYIKKRKFLYCCLFVSCVVMMISQVIIPIYLSNISAGMLELEWRVVRNGGIAIVILAAVRLISEYLWGHLDYYLSNKSLVEAENDYVQKYLKKEYAFISGNDFMYLSQRINNDIVVIMDYFNEKVPMVCCHVAKLSGIIVILFLRDVVIGLISLLCIIFVVVVYVVSRKKMYGLSKKTSESESYFFSYVSVKLSRVKEIKLGAKYSEIGNGFVQIGDKYVKNAVKYLDFSNLINILGTFFMTAFLAVYILISRGRYDAVQDISLGATLVLSIFYFQQIIEDTSYLLGYSGMRQKYLVSKTRLDNILNVPDDVDGKVLPAAITELGGDKLVFNYGEKKIIENMNFNFKKGKIYGICGKNGSGKSTLVLLLLGILKPISGSVSWNNIDIKEINRTQIIKNNIAVTSQEPVLLEKTIQDSLFENVRTKELTEDYRGLLEFVNGKEKGLATPVYINGTNLSGGEKQRIAIVNSLLKKPDVLIMDEPTSALDVGSISLLSKILAAEKRERITIIISHDKDFMEVCDEMVEIK